MNKINPQNLSFGLDNVVTRRNFLRYVNLLDQLLHDRAYSRPEGPFSAVNRREGIWVRVKYFLFHTSLSLLLLILPSMYSVVQDSLFVQKTGCA